jgi:hypothetical protein
MCFHRLSFSFCIYFFPTLPTPILSFFSILADLGEQKFINCLCAILCIFRFERPDFPQFFSGATPLVGRFVIVTPSLNILTIWFWIAR